MDTEKEFNILILEDTPSDAMLIERELKLVFPKYKNIVVDNESDFLKALSEFSPDLIISDYQLPTFNGLAALTMAHEKNPFIPFIICTGAMNEDIAVNCMKAGADDYVLKDHLKRLRSSALNAMAKKKMVRENKEAEQSLKESEQSYRTLFEESPVPLWEEDFSEVKIHIDTLKANGVKEFKKYFNNNSSEVEQLARSVKILEFNKAALKLHKANSKEELSRGLSKIISIESMPAVLEQLIAIAEEKTSCVVEGIVKSLLGEIIVVRISWLVVPGYENSLKKVYVSTIDITERKLVEKELLKAKDDAEKADRLKSIFLAQMSHEIRTPINAMLSLTSLLKDDMVEFADDDQKMSFDLVDKAGNRIVRTVDLLLNLSEIQAGTYEPILKRCNLYSDILSELIVKFKKLAKEKNIDLNIKLSSSDCDLVADSYTVNQIFEQLLDNAIKYTNSGKVDVILMRDDENLCVQVSDTGIGILDEYLPHLFDPFSQEETGYTRKYEGSGIGLSLVKYYCKINNAEIKVKSKKDIGSTFTVVFNNN